MDLTGYRYNIAHDGFTVIEDIYTGTEVNAMINTIENLPTGQVRFFVKRMMYLL